MPASWAGLKIAVMWLEMTPSDGYPRLSGWRAHSKFRMILPYQQALLWHFIELDLESSGCLADYLMDSSLSANMTFNLSTITTITCSKCKAQV